MVLQVFDDVFGLVLPSLDGQGASLLPQYGAEGSFVFHVSSKVQLTKACASGHTKARLGDALGPGEQSPLLEYVTWNMQSINQ